MTDFTTEKTPGQLLDEAIKQIKQQIEAAKPLAQGLTSDPEIKNKVGKYMDTAGTFLSTAQKLISNDVDEQTNNILEELDNILRGNEE